MFNENEPRKCAQIPSKTAWVVLINDSWIGEENVVFNPGAICELQSTAQRMADRISANGSETKIEPMTVFKMDGYWYGPITILQPSITDKETEDKINKYKSTMKRAEELGMTKEEIEILTNGI